MAPQVRDLTGQTFGKWTVISRAPSKRRRGLSSNTDTYWNCRCECGTEKPVMASNLTSGMSSQCPSCGKRAGWEKRKANRLGGKRGGTVTITTTKMTDTKVVDDA